MQIALLSLRRSPSLSSEPATLNPLQGLAFQTAATEVLYGGGQRRAVKTRPSPVRARIKAGHPGVGPGVLEVNGSRLLCYAVERAVDACMARHDSPGGPPRVFSCVATACPQLVKAELSIAG
jgi:hypothetical protein